MNKIVMLALTALIIGITSPIAAVAQTAKDFIGTWTLVSAITERDGNKSETFGPNAKGVLMLDADGHYTMTFISASLPKFASNNRATGTADENKAIVGGSLAHFGSYVVNEADKSITFRVERATFPNWDNTDQKRSFVMTGDELRYLTPSATAGGTATVTWKRVK
jgi:Lipocalin-like domain